MDLRDFEDRIRYKYRQFGLTTTFVRWGQFLYSTELKSEHIRAHGISRDLKRLREACQNAELLLKMQEESRRLFEVAAKERLTGRDWQASQPIISYSLAVNRPQVICQLLRLSCLTTHQRMESRAPSSQGPATGHVQVLLHVFHVRK